MKSRLVYNEDVQEVPYPKMMVLQDSGCVVLFTSPSEGVCLVVGSSSNTIGLHQTTWLCRAFEDFEGGVEITN